MDCGHVRELLSTKGVMIFVVRILVAAFLAGQPATAEQLVTEFSGADSTTTRDFTVDGPWLLEWRLDADYDQLVALDVWLEDAGTRNSAGRILRREARGNGLKLFEDGGRYRLRISATLARWRIQIKQLTPEEAERYTPRERSGPTLVSPNVVPARLRSSPVRSRAST
jgi:hypothetical protein